MLSLALSALLCSAPVPPAFQPAAPVWRTDADGTADLGLWLGDRFLGRWSAATKQYRPYDGTDYGPPCALPPDAPQYRQTAPPPLAYRPAFYQPVFFGSFGSGCANGRCGR